MKFRQLADTGGFVFERRLGTSTARWIPAIIGARQRSQLDDNLKSIYLAVRGGTAGAPTGQPKSDDWSETLSFVIRPAPARRVDVSVSRDWRGAVMAHP
jgi:hypothetical protein